MTTFRKLKIINEERAEKRNTLAYQVFSGININGQPGNRFGAVYRTVGCEYDKIGKGCLMCDFSLNSDPEITDKNLMNQHDVSLEKLESGVFNHFDLATLGNFYHDKEISPKAREYMLSTLAKIPAVKRVLTESRRQYVDVD